MVLLTVPTPAHRAAPVQAAKASGARLLSPLDAAKDATGLSLVCGRSSSSAGAGPAAESPAGVAAAANEDGSVAEEETGVPRSRRASSLGSRASLSHGKPTDEEAEDSTAATNLAAIPGAASQSSQQLPAAAAQPGTSPAGESSAPLAGSEESGAEEASLDQPAAVSSRPGGWGAAEEQPIAEAVAEEAFSAVQPGDVSRQLSASEPEEASIGDFSHSRRSSSADLLSTCGEAAVAEGAFAGLGQPDEKQPVTAVMLAVEAAAGAGPAAVAEPAVAAVVVEAEAEPAVTGAAAAAEAEEGQHVEAGLPQLGLGTGADTGAMPVEETVLQPASGCPESAAEVASGGAGAEGQMEAAEAVPLGEASVAGGADAEHTEQRPAVQQSAMPEAAEVCKQEFAAADEQPLCGTGEQAAVSLGISVQPAAEGEELAASLSAAQSETSGAPSAPPAASADGMAEASAAAAGQWREAAAVTEDGCSSAASAAAEQLCLLPDVPATTGGGVSAAQGALPLSEGGAAAGGGTAAAGGEAEQPQLEGGARKGSAVRLLPLQQATLCEAVTADKPEAGQENASCEEAVYCAPAADRSCSGMQVEACVGSRADPSRGPGDEACALQGGQDSVQRPAGMEAADSAEALSLTQRASASLLFGGGSSDGAGGDGSGGAGMEAGAGKGGPQAADGGTVDGMDLPAAPAAEPASSPDGNINATSGGDSRAAAAAAAGLEGVAGGAV